MMMSGGDSQMQNEPFHRDGRRYSAFIVVIALAVGLVIGGGLGFMVLSGQVDGLRQQIQALQGQVQNASSASGTVTLIDGNVSISALYQSAKDSVVVISGTVVQNTFFGPAYAEVQGSGFVYNLTGQMVIVTNFHVVNGASNITVTFSDGDAYSGNVLGTDPYSDLAVLSANAPSSEFNPLPVVSSLGLRVGDPVMAIGSPFGLAGSVTTGIVSQLGRTISEQSAGGYPIADVIQISAPINPGNSGGPLLNYLGQVIGITTATVSGSQGLGFAIPSSTILREVGLLATTGKYADHPWLGVSGTDMNYDISQAMGVNVTYGWLIQSVVSGSPADRAGLRGGNRQVLVGGSGVTLGGDLIVAINGTRIISGDDVSSYLERYTLPGQTIVVTLLRNGQFLNVALTLGTRPASGP
jgi:S1-C subfamily serine protease